MTPTVGNFPKRRPRSKFPKNLASNAEFSQEWRTRISWHRARRSLGASGPEPPAWWCAETAVGSGRGRATHPGASVSARALRRKLGVLVCTKGLARVSGRVGVGSRRIRSGCIGEEAWHLVRKGRLLKWIEQGDTLTRSFRA